MTKQSSSQSRPTEADNRHSVLNIPGTARTPEVLVDPEKGYLSIGGNSMPENVNKFFAPVLEHIQAYIENPAGKTRVVFRIEYINSSSSQLMLAILYKLKELEKKDHPLTIEWHFMVDDEDIYETGKSYAELSGLTFNFYEHQ